MREEWKPVRNYEGLYEVSNLGRVKSLERMKRNGRGYYKTPEKIMKGVDNGHGYLEVVLFKEGKGKHYTIHKLVATAFLENPMGYTELNHRDENKQNNCVENLEYCSRLYNNTYNDRAKKAGKKSAEKLRGRKQSEEHIRKKSKPVFSVDKESGLIMWWKSIREAERQTGIAQSSITKCCKGKMKSCGNHYWFYADDDNE